MKYTLHVNDEQTQSKLVDAYQISPLAHLIKTYASNRSKIITFFNLSLKFFKCGLSFIGFFGTTYMYIYVQIFNC